MDAEGSRKRSFMIGGTLVLVLLGIVLLGSSGVAGLFVLAIALALGIVIVLRA